MRPDLSEGIYPNNSAALFIEFCLTYRNARKRLEEQYHEKENYHHQP